MKLKYTPEAIADLQGLRQYIGKVLHNPKAADRIAKSILDQCGQLKRYPKLGREFREKADVDTDLRYLVCDNHIALYRTEDDLILIARILDGRTDYMRILFKE